MTWLGHAGLDLGEHADRRADLARRAVAALEAVVLDERRLQRVQVVRRAQPLDGDDLVALVHDRERQAGVDAPAVDQHRAGAALAVVAALLGAGECRCSRRASSSVVRGSSSRSCGLAIYFEGNLRRGRRFSGSGRGGGNRGLSVQI